MIHRSVEVPLPCLVNSVPVKALRLMQNPFGGVLIDSYTAGVFHVFWHFRKPYEQVSIFEK